MRRRCFIGLFGAALARPSAAFSQARTWRIGWLSPDPAPHAGETDPDLDAFEKALTGLGYVEGKIIAL